jgi:hypothetical protein
MLEDSQVGQCKIEEGIGSYQAVAACDLHL